MIAWPDCLPCILVDGYGYQRKDLALRTKMITGRLRARRRFGNAPATVSATCQMDQFQFAYFESWWLHRLEGGSLSFDAPIQSGAEADTHECMMTGPYRVTAVGPSEFRIGMDLQALNLAVSDAL